MLGEMFRRLSYFRRRSRFDGELSAEIQFHIDARATELEKEGLARAEAMAQARREFGSRLIAAEDSRSAWQFAWVEQALADLRHAARSFARRPIFAVTAISCLAIGIAANTLIFSLVNAVFLRPLPYSDADRIVSVRFSPPGQPDQKLGSNSGTYFYVRDHSSIFERTGAVRITGISISSDVGAEAWQWFQIANTSPGLTDVMGVSPKLGRWYTEEDSLAVVISHRLWMTMFGGADDVLGKKLSADGLSLTIVGVMPPGYRTLDADIDLWRLQRDEDLANALRSPNRVFHMFGRLKPAVSIAEAESQLNALGQSLGEEYEMNRGWTIRVDSLRDLYAGYLRQPLLILQGAVFLLLLIACANVGGLLLSQAAARQREMVVRAALGSSRGRIVRQLLTENVLLALLGGIVGGALAWGGLRTVLSTALASNPDLQDASLDWRVLGFTLVIALATALFFGLAPAMQTSRPDLMEAVRESGRSHTGGVARRRLRSALVVVQVALALVLLTGSGLLIRTLINLNAADPGLNPQNVVAIRVPFSRSFYRFRGQNTTDGGLLVEFDDRFTVLSESVRQRLAAVPGVASATTAVTPPLGGDPHRVQFTRPGQIVTKREQGAWSAEWYPVSGGYFETLRIALQRGRTIEVEDRKTSRPVAVINETLALQFFPNEDPLGRQIQIGVLDDLPREIVGVVADVRQDRYQTASQPQIYVPRTQLPYRMDMTMSLDVIVPSFLVRTTNDAASIRARLQAAIREVAPVLPVSSVRTVEEYAADQLQDVERYAVLLSLFGTISLMLALTGIFGLMAHAVSQRTNEIGLRIALGAQRGDVMSLILQKGLVLIGAGVVLGLGASLLLTPVIRSFLWGVSAADPVTFALAGAGLAVVALLACCLPAWRAVKVDPVVALRSE
jgi:putative ABC transport system permease protein